MYFIKCSNYKGLFNNENSPIKNHSDLIFLPPWNLKNAFVVHSTSHDDMEKADVSNM